MPIASLDVVVVGAGPAGVGMGIALARLGLGKSLLVERARVGESFLCWPRETRFITPSFHSNPFGLADLNAVSETSSVAIASGMEHPDGPAYARYLEGLVQAHALRVLTGCGVEAVGALPGGGGFLLRTSRGSLRARVVVWATGEFQFPDLAPFEGAGHCRHYAQVESWRDLGPPGVRRLVIGGYESGVDAAASLVALGHEVTLLARKSSWDAASSHDPSLSLSPYSRERLAAALGSGRLAIAFGASVAAVRAAAGGGWHVLAADGRCWHTGAAPVLGTGFVGGGGARQIAPLFAWSGEGHVQLTAQDESTLVPGLFLAGPQVRQDARIYCFVYKFRQRFAVVGRAVAERLGRDARALEAPGGAWGPFGNGECCEGCEC